MDKWVISLSGERGKGPWDKAQSSPGSTVPATEQREAYPWRILDLAREECRQYRTHGHPHAKVFRLVRRSKASLATLERAVVEAAEQWEEGYSSLDALGEKYSRRRAALAAAVRALRAKRGG